MTGSGNDNSGRKARKERYERVLGVIKYNTGGPQLPGCSSRVVRQCLVANGSMTNPKKIEKALKATVERGDCIKWEGRDGTTLFTRTNEEDLKQLIGHENQHPNPRDEVIQKALAHLKTG